MPGLLDGKRIVSEESILERRKPKIKMGESMSYGLGLCVMNEQGLSIIGHAGGTLGFSSDLFFFPDRGIGIVMLANSRFAHPFLNTVKQKFLELTFSADQHSEEMIHLAMLADKAFIKQNHEHVSLDTEKMAWIEDLLGDYSSDTLGKARLSKSSNGGGYKMAFEEWETRVGSEVEKNGKKILTLVDGPFPGFLKLLVENNGAKLVINLGQEEHDFIRKT